jgi:hypothetical protein
VMCQRRRLRVSGQLIYNVLINSCRNWLCEKQRRSVGIYIIYEY